MGRELALERRAVRRGLPGLRRRPRRRAATFSASSRVVGQKRGIDTPRRGERRRRIGRVGTRVEREKRSRAVEPAGVEMRQTEALGEPARQRPLARGGRPVDRDDKGAGRRHQRFPGIPGITAGLSIAGMSIFIPEAAIR